MPELHFHVRWPDDSTTACYSPSSTIRDALKLHHPYPLHDFVAASRAALEHASERVAQKYGWGCGHAAAQIREIEHLASRYASDPQATVTVVKFE
ncbi:MSMEG_0570 family protein [Hydrocarboniphaga daqingensis]|jgi:uncharacterized repeat protein (TIGR04042 family)|uniref:MSMEG_0570 family protein n=1 Tax=Hydrocarboniphaga daqingensis TaxID=490188 RepID=A0A1M5RCL0_9GAMM|nr:MSMEG_0570 family nitrogen starvation response protein [Hydrocarboniphaga daqingensis]SHH24102.1 MSMEG_0570 family protein [Hydrocarboniphaga daqingensis]